MLDDKPLRFVCADLVLRTLQLYLPGQQLNLDWQDSGFECQQNLLVAAGSVRINALSAAGYQFRSRRQ